MQIRTAYSYNSMTKEYSGETFARESPREPGVFHLPAHATETPPPKVGVNEIAVFDGGQWVLKPDYRGHIYYSTETQEKQIITEIGAEPAGDWTQIAPADMDAIWTGQAWQVPFETLKGRKVTEVLALSADKMSSVETGYSLGEVKTFEQQYQGAVDLLGGNTDTVAAQFVMALAAKRSEVGGVEVTADALARRVIDNYTKAKEYTVYILGIQQGLMARIQLADTEEEVAAVMWPE